MWRIESWCSPASSFKQPDEVAGRCIDEGERGLHRVEVELGAAKVGMGLDAAIGDRERPAIGHQQDFVRTDAVGREFADARVAGRTS